MFSFSGGSFASKNLLLQNGWYLVFILHFLLFLCHCVPYNHWRIDRLLLLDWCSNESSFPSYSKSTKFKNNKISNNKNTPTKCWSFEVLKQTLHSMVIRIQDGRLKKSTRNAEVRFGSYDDRFLDFQYDVLAHYLQPTESSLARLNVFIFWLRKTQLKSYFFPTTDLYVNFFCSCIDKLFGWFITSF